MTIVFDASQHRFAGHQGQNQTIDDPAAVLVANGFRSWYLGFETGDINCWETGWQYMREHLGHIDAKHTVTELACWVRTIHEAKKRPISVYPIGCDRFNADERLAISLVAAAQDKTCPALMSCAYALIGDQNVEQVIGASHAFSSMLKHTGVSFQQTAF